MIDLATLISTASHHFLCRTSHGGVRSQLGFKNVGTKLWHRAFPVPSLLTDLLCTTTRTLTNAIVCRCVANTHPIESIVSPATQCVASRRLCEYG
ncbi:hypothetical protein KPSA3_04616 [Pseudomonas syringae pv. actinidiae]|uniref:Uncharacterized protein n=1 Tax=Pseudomonas syringae pv. actinidiae TaxID=103796 RepID=A0AAN4Q7C8_PSESF|nr:hypothetical protein KPSA3_04616 [Pseudomonas syringae pv. actinidiae]